MNEVATKLGERATIRLVDGTRITLNVDSRLRYAQSYGVSARDVYLDGEAYFDVTHDVAKPFVVHTRAGLAEDLGTAFAVRAYTEDSSTQVVVTSGRVALHPTLSSRPASVRAGAITPALLSAGDLARVRTNGTLDVQRDVNANPYIAFTEGKIIFDDTPVREALRRLSRWYDLDFQLTDSTLARHKITASFRGESPEKVIALIAFTLQARYEQYGRTVAFSPPSPAR
jgi:ferric-dicitrate binding protein FerR (iron transport regulator)